MWRIMTSVILNDMQRDFLEELLFRVVELSYQLSLEVSGRSRSEDSRLCKSARTYDAKWRSYYDPAMDRHYELRREI